MEDFKCVGPNCKRPDKKITWGEYKYSMSVFKKQLCVECQMEERVRINPVMGSKINNISLSYYANKSKEKSDIDNKTENSLNCLKGVKNGKSI